MYKTITLSFLRTVPHYLVYITYGTECMVIVLKKSEDRDYAMCSETDFLAKRLCVKVKHGKHGSA